MKILNHCSDFNELKQMPEVRATDIIVELQSMVIRLKGKYLTDDGKAVDYKRLRNDKIYSQFLAQVSLLSNISLTGMNVVQRKAFFLNVYNIMTIHGLCDVEVLPLSVLDIKNFWKTTVYDIAGLTFSLDDIEHGILRANTTHPSETQKPFAENDLRCRFALPELDPRIHFALNCGAKSCPAINVYNENNLEKALNNATVNFLKDTFVVCCKTYTVHLSKLFLWYRSDFGSNDRDILRWVTSFLSDEQKQAITQVLDSDRLKLVYDEYNWHINVV